MKSYKNGKETDVTAKEFAEMQKQAADLPNTGPSDSDRLAALESAVLAMMEVQKNV